MSDSVPISVPGTTAASQCRVVVVGSSIESLVRGREGFGNYADIVAAYASLDDWPEAAPEADLLIVGTSTLFQQTIEAIQDHLAATGASRAVVVYDFANSETEAAAREPASQITTMRGPVTAAELRAACEADIALASIRDQWAESGDALRAEAEIEIEDPVEAPEPDGQPVRQRQFTESQVARIARVSTTVECECPHHLASLLTSLNAFEDYSLACENRNEEDAILHNYLYRSTAKARAIVEDALVVLIEAEGIEID